MESTPAHFQKIRGHAGDPEAIPDGRYLMLAG
jgi:hypothetical protein